MRNYFEHERCVSLLQGPRGFMGNRGPPGFNGSMGEPGPEGPMVSQE